MLLTPHGIAAIVITVGALIMFSRERIPLEYSCLCVLAVLVIGFELFPYAGNNALRGAIFLQGFGNEALVTICLLLMLAKGVEASGALRPIGRFLTRIWLTNRSLAMLVTLVVAAFISAFANNTPIVVMLLPILVGVAHRIGVSPSRMLMPVGFATIIGGMSTTIGTSTNLLVVSVSEQLGMQRLEMFDFAYPAVIAAGVAMLYLWLVLPRMLPERASLLAGTKPRIFDSIIHVSEESPLAGTTLGKVRKEVGEGIRVTRIERGAGLELVRLPTLTILHGDRLHVRGTPEAIQLAQEAFGNLSNAEAPRRAPEERLVEIVVTRDSPLHGKRLSELRRDTLRGLHPIGWYRSGQGGLSTPAKPGDPLLRTGDVLLMQGNRQDVQQLVDTPHILLLARSIQLPRTSKAALAIGVMTGVVVVAALGIMPIVASALTGVGLMLAGRCLTWAEAWSALDARLVLVIVASLAMGSALTQTGAAAFLGGTFVDIVAGLPPHIVLSGLILLTALLTEVVTNNAVAIIATPIAMSVAAEFGLSPVPFVLAVLFGANMSYLTPIGYQTNVLVMSAGNYRFADFFRAGLPLQIILWITLSVLLTRIYL